MATAIPTLGTAHHAVVDVLTADVRVLMVGSRQVTLSVARQLDVVPYDEVVPFGRVRLSTTDPARQVTVIGKHHTGTLVISRLDPPSDEIVLETGALRVCNTQQPTSSRAYYEKPRICVAWGARHFRVAWDSVRWCGVLHAPTERCVPLWAGPMDQIEMQVDENEDDLRRYREALGLPLIVLAGLGR